MKLWLDDIRDPNYYGHLGWTWVTTAAAAIEALQTGTVVIASLDHDLSIPATLGEPCTEPTGYDVVCWMEEHNVWPEAGVSVHSMNPVGRQRMLQVISRHYEQDKGTR